MLFSVIDKINWKTTCINSCLLPRENDLLLLRKSDKRTIYFFVFSSIRKASVGSSWCHGLYPVSRLVLYYILPVVCHITLPSPSTRRKKHQHINKNQTFSTIYSRSFVLGKEKFQRKRRLPACIAGVSAGCANVSFSDNVFILL